MGLEDDIEIEIAVAAAVRAFASLTRHAQALAVRRSFRDPYFEAALTAPGHSARITLDHA